MFQISLVTVVSTEHLIQSICNPCKNCNNRWFSISSDIHYSIQAEPGIFNNTSNTNASKLSTISKQANGVSLIGTVVLALNSASKIVRDVINRTTSGWAIQNLVNRAITNYSPQMGDRLAARVKRDVCLRLMSDPCANIPSWRPPRSVSLRVEWAEAQHVEGPHFR